MILFLIVEIGFIICQLRVDIIVVASVCFAQHLQFYYGTTK